MTSLGITNAKIAIQLGARLGVNLIRVHPWVSGAFGVSIIVQSQHGHLWQHNEWE